MLRERVASLIVFNVTLLTFVFMLLPQIGSTGQGNPAIGEALFVGKTAFVNGGAPCLGCHAIAGIGSAGAANFGPDLTALYEENEAEGVAEILESLLDFPSMEAIYTDRPLTEDERLNLTSFFGKVSEEQSGTTAGALSGKVLFGGIISIVLFIGVFALMGWRRLTGVRRPLVEQSRKQRGEN
jgi:hypothetical protein